ncbi:hypothetical protein SBF1_5340004 [Candidatus Desulfosporosinus infrequens]|uniref:Uncharacterized protein n=1 Tax=Candidatus Desulfosporosinus infrequens TaxID=2043169 RepID=A0A2U3LIV2_9FIRM|nr:hypothetical protein SBF1_5340004 [Candidatus Desulfosporosinus infrequens]
MCDEHSYVSLTGKVSNRQLSVEEDYLVDSLKKLSEIIHKNGCSSKGLYTNPRNG